MLYELHRFADGFQPLNLFSYITFRTGGALLTSLLLSLVMGAPFIRWLRAKQGKGQPIRADGPERHIVEKAGTPTMGGFLILFALLVATLLWADLSNPYIWVILLVTTGFGAIGFIDDFNKVTKQSHEGLSGRVRLGLEFAIAGAAALMLSVIAAAGNAPVVAAPIEPAGAFDAAGLALTAIAEAAGASTAPAPEHFATSLAVPFFKDVLINLTIYGFVVFGALVIVGSGNAVNLTDGLDGLAIAPVMIAAATFGFMAYIIGTPRFADYLFLPAIPGVSEISVLIGALLGAGLGFLWYNAPPAMVFMGDTGSLALGGALGAVAVAVKQEIVLAVVGGIFVLETVSVMVQVASFKLFGRRVFRMAPIHHHFEKMGWREPTIVIRFWIIAVVLAIIGLATLKLR